MKRYLGLKTADVCFKSQTPIKYCTRILNAVNVKDLTLSQGYYGSINTFTTITSQQYTQYTEY